MPLNHAPQLIDRYTHFVYKISMRCVTDPFNMLAECSPVLCDTAWLKLLLNFPYAIRQIHQTCPLNVFLCHVSVSTEIPFKPLPVYCWILQICPLNSLWANRISKCQFWWYIQWPPGLQLRCSDSARCFSNITAVKHVRSAQTASSSCDWPVHTSRFCSSNSAFRQP
jgi:hypothetical protein